MKVLHINTNDVVGGAARASSGLSKSLRALGVNSSMLVQDKKEENSSVFKINGGLGSKIWRRLVPYFEQFSLECCSRYSGQPWSLNLFPRAVYQDINAKDVDIAHFHWVGGGYFPLYTLRHIQSKIIWTLHDSWLFTGGCHVPYDCKRYETQCGQCPQLKSSFNWDISQLGLKTKKNCILNRDIIFVSPSHWLRNCALNSAVLRHERVEVIPNGVDLSLFRPINKSVARDVLGFPSDAKLILCGAIGAFSDPNKGGDLFLSACTELRDIYADNVELVVFGASNPGIEFKMPLPTRFMGRIHDNITLALLYSAADVFVCPSLQENLPTTVIEASACGTPSVGFSCSGLPEVIEHGETGYLATPYDTADLAHGIRIILDNSMIAASMGQNARLLAEKKFDVKLQAKKYLSLYQNLLC